MLFKCKGSWQVFWTWKNAINITNPPWSNFPIMKSRQPRNEVKVKNSGVEKSLCEAWLQANNPYKYETKTKPDLKVCWFMAAEQKKKYYKAWPKN